jgi:DNA recombination protein RmuC
VIDRPLLVIAGYGISPLVLLLTGIALSCFLALWVLFMLGARSRSQALREAALAEQTHEMDDKMAELLRIQSEITGRLQGVAEVFGARQGDIARAVNDRMESLQHRLGQRMEETSRHQMTHLASLNERLAVIDTAQKNLQTLTGEILSLRDVLSNRQSRGAFGQGMMESIIRDGLPSGFYEFQVTLSNNSRPDCLIRLPGDERGLVVDAKFPLEAFLALREARDPAQREQALRRIAQDMGVHIRQMASRYLLAGETQDIALMFVPAESVYADLYEHCPDLLQKAQRARILIVSPSLLVLSVQIIQSLARDARVREEARTIQIEVGKLLEDVSRLNDRIGRLDQHFRQAQEDVVQIRTSSDKIQRRGQVLSALDFEGKPSALLAAAE